MTNNPLVRLSVAQFKKAAAIKERIEDLERELTGLIGIPEPLTIGGMVRRKRRLSAAARKRISEATKKRWAKYRARKAGKDQSATKA